MKLKENQLCELGNIIPPIKTDKEGMLTGGFVQSPNRDQEIGAEALINININFRKGCSCDCSNKNSSCHNQCTNEGCTDDTTSSGTTKENGDDGNGLNNFVGLMVL